MQCIDYYSNDYVLLPTLVKLRVLSDIKVIQHECKSTDTKRKQIMICTRIKIVVQLIKDIMQKAMKVWVSPCFMTTPHIGDEDELVTADQAHDEPEQPAQAENTAPPDPADEAEPDEVEPDDVSREMERSLPAPTAFNIDATDLYSKWKHWSSAVEIYSIASDLLKKEDAVQRATMLYCLGPTVKRIFNTLPGEHKSLKEAKTALNGYYAPKRNVVAERSIAGKILRLWHFGRGEDKRPNCREVLFPNLKVETAPARRP